MIVLAVVVTDAKTSGCSAWKGKSDSIEKISVKYVNPTSSVAHVGIEVKAGGKTYAAALNSQTNPLIVGSPSELWCQEGGFPMKNKIANGGASSYTNWKTMDSYKDSMKLNLGQLYDEVNAWASA